MPVDIFDVWFVVERVLLAAALAWLLTRDILNRQMIADLRFDLGTLEASAQAADAAVLDIVNDESYREELARDIVKGVEREFDLTRKVFDESGEGV